jgi:hypothetical protein
VLGHAASLGTALRAGVVDLSQGEESEREHDMFMATDLPLDIGDDWVD